MQKSPGDDLVQLWSLDKIIAAVAENTEFAFRKDYLMNNLA